MGVAYVSVQWNRQKKFYDAALVGGVAVYLAAFGVLTKLLFPFVTDEIMLMRAFGTAALLLLHFILCIGPLCRLNPKFLPLLYNRRHAGVTVFTLALVHAALVVLTYHAGSTINPIASIFASSPLTRSTAGVPFQPFGFLALVILFLMAATSHDFWLANLSAPVWKALHMLVYAAYALLLLHVTFGVLQGETHPLYATATAAGLATVLGLHVAAARKSRPLDEEQFPSADDGFLDACAVADIPENRARIVCLSGERVAIFKYDGRVSAVSNVCQHQNGPLGEGKIIHGCITCPWHGYQYQPDSGASPAPFVEKVPTFEVRIRNGRVFVHPQPNPAGTRVEPALIARPLPMNPPDEFYIGWEAKAAPGIAKSLHRTVAAVLLAVVVLAVLFAFAQRLITTGVFEWGSLKSVAGVLQARPYPRLLVQRPGNVAGLPAFSTYYLVAPWKFGLDREAIAPLDGKPVTIKGTLIYRGNQTMIETKPEWIQAAAGPFVPPRASAPVSLGRQTLVGEIVDSKCFLGVMNPGRFIPHRACAIRCISGGVPPVFVVQAWDGSLAHFLLVSAAGKPVNQQVLDLVAEPVEITGEVERQGELLILKADPAIYRRTK